MANFLANARIGLAAIDVTAGGTHILKPSRTVARVLAVFIIARRCRIAAQAAKVNVPTVVDLDAFLDVGIKLLL